ncbi:MAG: hypothetical protein Q9159_007484 [Coniocarpon cinnabarinum]
MEASNLQTAAGYVNNLLLARGLLRNGKAVEFAHLATCQPKEESTKKHQIEAPLVVADIINLVHDLILKRDRDAEHHETLAASLRTIRNQTTRNESELEGLKSRNAELRRQLAAAESSQRTAEATAKRAEATARALREDLNKAKKIVEQVRTACATDIRKRDVQIDRLKNQLDSRQQQRGTNRNTSCGGLVVTITPGVTGIPKTRKENKELPSVEDERYNLRQESTEFLTQLSQSLSDENDQLISLVRSTLSTLRELQGMPHNQLHRLQDPSSHGGSSTGTLSLLDTGELVHVDEVSCETLAHDLQTVIGSLSELLTNPSFAPIEEVHVREEEIHRLREGWEKMERRWHEAMGMMQSWRKRLIRGGDTVGLDELKKGLRLGDGLDSPSREPYGLLPKPHAETEEQACSQRESTSEEVEGVEDVPDVDDLPAVEDELDIQAEKPLFDVDAAQHDKPLFAVDDDDLGEKDNANSNQSGLGLREADLNTVAQPGSVHDQPSGRKISDAENSSPVPVKPRSRATDSTNSRYSNTKSKASTAPSRAVANRPAKAPNTRLPARKAPVPKTRASGPQRQSPAPERSLNVGEKLQLAEREARRMSSSPLNLNEDTTQTGPESPLERKAHQREQERPQDAGGTDEMDASTVGSLRREGGGKSPVKRTRILGRPRRRKSTLSPEELEGLMLGR